MEILYINLFISLFDLSMGFVACRIRKVRISVCLNVNEFISLMFVCFWSVKTTKISKSKQCKFVYQSFCKFVWSFKEFWVIQKLKNHKVVIVSSVPSQFINLMFVHILIHGEYENHKVKMISFWMIMFLLEFAKFTLKTSSSKIPLDKISNNIYGIAMVPIECACIKNAVHAPWYTKEFGNNFGYRLWIVFLLSSFEHFNTFLNRNNCCRFFTSYWIDMQNVHQPYSCESYWIERILHWMLRYTKFKFFCTLQHSLKYRLDMSSEDLLNCTKVSTKCQF